MKIRSLPSPLVVGGALAGLTLIGSIATSQLSDWHVFYPHAIAWAFLFWNSVRILTYVPTVRLLLRPGASARDYSVLTWGSWVCSNGTLALYLFEVGGHRIDSLVLLNTGNSLMCLLTCALIVRLRLRDPSVLRAEARSEPALAALPQQPLSCRARHRRPARRKEISLSAPTTGPRS